MIVNQEVEQTDKHEHVVQDCIPSIMNTWSAWRCASQHTEDLVEFPRFRALVIENHYGLISKS